MLPLAVLVSLALLPGPAAAARRAVLVLRPELPAEAVFSARSPLAPLLPRAAIGVMNAAVRGPRDPASAYLTLGAGERVAAGPLAGLTPILSLSSALTVPGWSAFRSTVDPDFPRGGPQAAGGLGQALSARGGVAWLGVEEAARTRRGALTAVDASGPVLHAAVLDRTGSPQGPDLPLRLDLQHPLLKHAPLVIVDLPPSFDTGRLAALLAELLGDPERDVLLLSPYPAPGAGGAWDRLPPVLGFGPDFPPGRLTSATTRTPDLIANIDVAPSLLAALGAPVPATMSGHRMRVEAGGNAAALLQFAQAATAAQRAIIPLGIGIGAAAVMALALCLLAFRERRSPETSARIQSGSTGTLRRPAPLPGDADRKVGATSCQSNLDARLTSPARGALLLVAASPLALLLAPLTGATTVVGLGAAAAGGSLVAAAAAVVLSARFAPSFTPSPPHPLTPSPPHPPRPSPLLWLYALTVIVVAGDLLLGGALVARSPLSGFAVAGIRFYGVGNEYVGVLVGMGIMAPLLFEKRLARLRWLQASFFLGLALLIGSPRYGANLGGPPAAAAGFVTTLILASRSRRPLLVVAAAAGAILAAAAVVFLWDALRPAPLRSHIGEFVHAFRTGGWAAVLPVLRRKEAMNLRLLTSPYALIPIAVVLPLLALWYRSNRPRLRALLAHRPELRAAIGGSLVAAWSALLLKDSGVSPWMFITVSMLAVLLDEQLRTHE